MTSNPSSHLKTDPLFEVADSESYNFGSNPSLSVDIIYDTDSIKKVTLQTLHESSTLEFRVNLTYTSPSFSKGHKKQLRLKKQILFWFESYLLKKNPLVTLPFDFTLLSPFTKKVLEQLLKIPFGTKKSYLEIASLINRQKAARAVGNACRLNPFPLLIPCHRVVGSNGALTGFAYGIPLKQTLLDFEVF